MRALEYIFSTYFCFGLACGGGGWLGAGGLGGGGEVSGFTLNL